MLAVLKVALALPVALVLVKNEKEPFHDWATASKRKTWLEYLGGSLSQCKIVVGT